MAELAPRYPLSASFFSSHRLPRPSAAVLVATLAIAPHVAAQKITNTPEPTLLASSSLLPDAPDEPQDNPPSGAPATDAARDTLTSPKQTSRILGVLPNFRSVSAGETLPPQTTKEKFTTGLQDSFDYSAFIFAGAQAGVAQATDSYPAFHQGAAGYARYFWHTFADSADENILVESIFPTLLREDSRYYTLGKGGFVKRSIYAISRAAITRADRGGETVNFSEIIGAGAAAGISNTYYPGQYNTWTKCGQRWATNIILDDALFYVKEFWPDINQHILHGAN